MPPAGFCPARSQFSATTIMSSDPARPSRSFHQATPRGAIFLATLLLAGVAGAHEPDGPGANPAPPSSLVGPEQPTPARNVRRGNSSRAQVLLSFDGGWGANGAPQILDVLARAGVRTTFFLTGDFIRRNPDLTRRIVADGHEVGNHTDHHPHLTRWASHGTHGTLPRVDRDLVQRELVGAEEAFQRVTGRIMAPFWRAPYGEMNAAIRSWAAELGYEHVGWTQGLDSLDWVADRGSARYQTADQFVRLLERRAAQPAGLRGAIILMHLDSARPPADRFAASLDRVLGALVAAGVRPVPASVLLDGPSSGSPAASATPGAHTGE